jgi:hypothetical protein
MTAPTLADRVAEVLPYLAREDQSCPDAFGYVCGRCHERAAVLALIETLIAEEREACAEICDARDGWREVAALHKEMEGGAPTEAAWMAGTLAMLIRARKGEKP